MPTWESDLPRYFFRPDLAYEITDTLANFLEGIFFAEFAPRHALFTLLSKQFQDFASLKEPGPLREEFHVEHFSLKSKKILRI